MEGCTQFGAVVQLEVATAARMHCIDGGCESKCQVDQCTQPRWLSGAVRLQVDCHLTIGVRHEDLPFQRACLELLCCIFYAGHHVDVTCKWGPMGWRGKWGL